MKQEIVEEALENLRQITGIEAIWQINSPLDGQLVLNINKIKVAFHVVIKKEVRNYQIREIEDYFYAHENFLLLAYHIFPKIKEELREKNIPYIEANGNLFIKKGDIFLFVDTKKALNIEKNNGNRAFTKTGLKVLFYLLQYKDAINLTHRELADKANVALGNIPQVFEGLKETGYIISLNNKSYIWENRKSLLDRWVTEYATVLRPKLFKEKYALKAKWQDIVFDKNLTLWGGEPAAEMLTNYLRAEKLSIYSLETRTDLIKKYHLQPDKNGEVEVLQMFWKHEKGETVPPILVYADLIREGGKRNNETAEKIYHEYIQANL